MRLSSAAQVRSLGFQPAGFGCYLPHSCWQHGYGRVRNVCHTLAVCLLQLLSMYPSTFRRVLVVAMLAATNPTALQLPYAHHVHVCCLRVYAVCVCVQLCGCRRSLLRQTACRMSCIQRTGSMTWRPACLPFTTFLTSWTASRH